MKLESKLTCPRCGRVEIVTMPEDNCVYFYQCTECKELLKPKDGDCCVFCSYGDTPCPSIQEKKKCC